MIQIISPPPRFAWMTLKAGMLPPFRKKHLFYSQGARSISAKDALSALTSASFLSKQAYHMQSEQTLR